MEVTAQKRAKFMPACFDLLVVSVKRSSVKKTQSWVRLFGAYLLTRLAMPLSI
jgi:hypothetical protein